MIIRGKNKIKDSGGGTFMERFRQIFQELFTLNPVEPNIFDITPKEKVNEDGYYSLEIANDKIYFRGVIQVILLDDKNQAFRKGLEQFSIDQDLTDKLATKYIHIFNKAASQHLNQFLHENEYTVEGDGDPEWIIIYKKDITEDLAKCQKNRDVIMTISNTVEKTSFRLVFNEIQRNYIFARNAMIKEAKENYIFQKQQSGQPKTQASTPATPTKIEATKALQIKLFSDTDKQALEKQVNQWLKENSHLEINGLEFHASSLGNQVESNIFIVYK